MFLKVLPCVLGVLLLAGCAASGKEAAYRQISQEDAISMMEEESDYIILDVRTPEEFAAGHIPDAINIPNESIGNFLYISDEYSFLMASTILIPCILFMTVVLWLLRSMPISGQIRFFPRKS